MIKPEWVGTIRKIEPLLMADSAKFQMINTEGIKSRMKEYKEYKQNEITEKKRIEDVKKNSMGKCKECGNYIPNTAVRGKDYHIFPIGLICQRCNRDPDKREKWMQRNK
jgi:RNA polymerase-binding transcription factor DksA